MRMNTRISEAENLYGLTRNTRSINILHNGSIFTNSVMGVRL